MTKSVSFSTVDVRSYNQILGDYPGSLTVALDWWYAPEDATSVEDYERLRKDCRRHGQEMRMPRWCIIERLMEHGYTRRHIQQHEESHRVQWKKDRQRMNNANRPEWHYQLDNARETVGRKLKRTLLLLARKGNSNSTNITTAAEDYYESSGSCQDDADHSSSPVVVPTPYSSILKRTPPVVETDTDDSDCFEEAEAN